MRASFFLLVALAGIAVDAVSACGSSYGTTESAEGDEGGADTYSLSGDATDEEVHTDAGPACDRTKPFGEPQPVAGIAPSSANLGARLSRNELTIYFHADTGNDAGGLDIFSATRSSLTAPFDPPTRLAVSSPADDSFPTMSGDGLTLIFERLLSAKNTDLYQATRPSTAVNFDDARPLVNSVQTSGYDSEPFLRLDGEVLYFISSRGHEAGLDLDIYRASKADGAFVSALPVTELNSAELEYLPVVTEDDLTIFWTSTRGSTPERYLRIFTASRERQSDPFSNIRPLDELNASQATYASWVSPDGCRLYFAADRTGPVELFVASRTR